MALDLNNEDETNMLSDFMCDSSESMILDVNPDQLIFSQHGDIFNQIAEDLGISTIPEDILSNDVFKCSYKEIQENFEISEFLNIKREPPSPNSSCDSHALPDTWNTLVNELTGSTGTYWNRLETPPSTPSQNSSDSSPPVSPSCNLQSEELSFRLTNSAAKTISSAFIPSNQLIITEPKRSKKIEPKLSFDLSQPPSETGTLPNTQLSNGVVPQGNQDVDLRAIKRQQRMIKNRESANLSRKKKREYVQNLEAELKAILEANHRLKIEKEQLLHRVSQLEKENRILKQSQSPVSLKKATALFAVVFMITLNLGPLGGIFLNNTKRLDDIQLSISNHHTRSLLWTNDNEDTDYLTNESGEFKSNLTSFGDNDTILHSICPMLINKTESLRLENELRGWVFRSEVEKSTAIFKNQMKKNKPSTLKLKNYLKGYPNRKSNFNEIDDFNKATDNKGLQLYQSVPQTYDRLLKAIKHRDDRYYVVSFTGDTLLLPARAQNKTRRPQMSLILPALPLNETARPPKDRVAMMQIDCEVMNTKIVYVKESLIPAHVRRQNMSSFQPSPASSSQNETKKSDTKM